MYKRYGHGCPPVPIISSVLYCCPVSSPSSGAKPESARMVVAPCKYAWIQSATSDPCNPQPVVLSTIVSPGAPYPLVPVGTTPASKTIQQQKQILVNDASNPYNPETRFAQYFPAPPIPYCPPTRIPNNDPKPSTRPCVPIQRFQGSSASQ
jgi:hypothetical protein